MNRSGHIITWYPSVEGADTLSSIASAGSKGLGGGATCALAGLDVESSTAPDPPQVAACGLLNERARVEYPNAAFKIQRPIKHRTFCFVLPTAKWGNLT